MNYPHLIFHYMKTIEIYLSKLIILKKNNRMKTKTIKRTVLLFTFLFFTFLSQAQAGLQFTGVKHFDISANGTASVSVPGGKVWKIESVSMGSTGSAPTVLLKNNSSQNIAFFSSKANAASASYPYWLPSSFTGTFVNNNPSYRCSVSITEYTVVP